MQPCAAGGFALVTGRSGSGHLAAIGPRRIAALLGEVATVASGYDLVLLGLPAGIDALVRRLLLAADTRLVVTTDEVRIAVNLAPSHEAGRATYQAIACVCERFLQLRPTLAGILRRDPREPDVIRHQTPLLARHPMSPAARDVEAMARQLLGMPCPRFSLRSVARSRFPALRSRDRGTAACRGARTPGGAVAARAAAAVRPAGATLTARLLGPDGTPAGISFQVRLVGARGAVMPFSTLSAAPPADGPPAAGEPHAIGASALAAGHPHSAGSTLEAEALGRNGLGRVLLRASDLTPRIENAVDLPVGARLNFVFVEGAPSPVPAKGEGSPLEILVRALIGGGWTRRRTASRCACRARTRPLPQASCA